MILALLFMFLFGSSDVNGLVQDISKPVQQVVQDKSTAKQIVALNKGMLKEEKALGKDIAKAKKSLAKLNQNRLASEAELTQVFTALDQKRAKAREKILDGRFQMKKQMTAEEWAKVYTVADAPAAGESAK
jgi:hypothetical protein